MIEIPYPIYIDDWYYIYILIIQLTACISHELNLDHLIRLNVDIVYIQYN